MSDLTEGRPPTPTPSVGRKVHYVQGDNTPCRAAIVAEVYPNHRCMLAAFAPSLDPFVHDVEHDEGRAVGTWHWPERI